MNMQASQFSNGTGDAPDWPLLPLLAGAALLSYARWAAPPAWAVDLLALLLAFSISQCALQCTQCWAALNTPALRWIVLGGGMALALLGAGSVQRWLWPAMSVPHPVWLMPLLLLGFVLLTILPAAIRFEVQRSAHEALQAEAQKHRVERQLLEARLAALQGQIEPHFLYNTLANARALIRQDGVAAEQMLNHLIAYLRVAMPDLRAATTSLGQELERAEAYLQIMQLRLGARLHFSIQAAPPARACLIPPLAVMTLVENAIQHAIEPSPAGGRLAIEARCEQEALIVEVSDDGAGFQSEGGSGVGLLNLQERLHAVFGATAELSLIPGQVSGITARISLPIKTGTPL
ncbi:MAG: histidine kinase [Burkholderiales bacterium]|nr:histidine kinase [Burkholderiales bacterium]